MIFFLQDAFLTECKLQIWHCCWLISYSTLQSESEYKCIFTVSANIFLCAPWKPELMHDITILEANPAPTLSLRLGVCTFEKQIL